MVHVHHISLKLTNRVVYIDRRIEDTPSINEHEFSKFKKGKDTSTRSFSHGETVKNSTDLLHKQSRRVNQEAAVQCSAEIHANPFTDGTII